MKENRNITQDKKWDKIRAGGPGCGAEEHLEELQAQTVIKAEEPSQEVSEQPDYLQYPTGNSYYLNYNLDGSKGYPGCIYSENYNVKDFSDPNTVLYGHNKKQGMLLSG